MITRSPWLSRLPYAPLLPLAVAGTIGLVIDRYSSIPVPGSLLFAVLAGISGIVTRKSQPGLGWVYLCLAFAGIAAAYHHQFRNSYSQDNIGNFAEEEPHLARVRGIIDEEPVVFHQVKESPLISQPRDDSTNAVLEVREILIASTWNPASGRVRLRIEGKVDDIHIGDEVEAIGWLAKPHGPMNPGESDSRQRFLDQQITAELSVKKSDQTLTRLSQGWRSSLMGWLGQVRAWGQRTLQRTLPQEQSSIAMALLLGEGSPMTNDDWERYIRTGVIHVLAISGQHLVVLGAFLWLVLQLLGVRRRTIAFIVGVFLFAYALLTGGRPSAMRAAIMVGAVCGGILLRKRPLPANIFACSWILVLANNPTELFHPGFQLSFLSVAVLIWGIPNWFPERSISPIEQLIDESRTPWVRFVRGAIYFVGQMYLITLILGIAIAPLIVYWQNLIAPTGILVGPPTIFLTSIALISGFLLLLSEATIGILSPIFSFITSQSLSLCEGLVRWADTLPGGCWYVGIVSEWWLIGFYALVIMWCFWLVLSKTGGDKLLVFGKSLSNRFFLISLLSWSVLGLLIANWRTPLDEVRITFLSVGHGGCTVIECPDGRVLLYDAGSLSGPELTRRHIAPFLWSRGISRIDEVFISHADLDHFNGLPALLQRFTVGQVTTNPTFGEKPTSGVDKTLAELKRHGVAIRIAERGDRLQAGELEIDVLHPSKDGPSGIENVRSLVLLLQHQNHRILFTGDIEKEGLQQLLELSPPKIDVLMAPHHGSRTANTPALRDWANPKFVISPQGPPRSALKQNDPYRDKKIPVWSTWVYGAIILHSHRTGLIVESFRTQERQVISMGNR